MCLNALLYASVNTSACLKYPLVEVGGSFGANHVELHEEDADTTRPSHIPSAT